MGLIRMTENKRFRLGYVCGDYGLIDNDEWIDLHSMSENSEKNVKICINKMNELAEENEQLKFENNELKCALALNEVDYIIADGKKIDIPPYYEFEQRYDHVMHRREYDGYD